VRASINMEREYYQSAIKHQIEERQRLLGVQSEQQTDATVLVNLKQSLTSSQQTTLSDISNLRKEIFILGREQSHLEYQKQLGAVTNTSSTYNNSTTDEKGNICCTAAITHSHPIGPPILPQSYLPSSTKSKLNETCVKCSEEVVDAPTTTGCHGNTDPSTLHNEQKTKTTNQKGNQKQQRFVPAIN